MALCQDSIKVDFDIKLSDDFEIVLLCLFKEKANTWLSDILPVLGNNKPKDLLTRNCPDVKTIEEGEKWVKVALMRGTHKMTY